MQEICLTKGQSSVARQTPVFMRCAEAFLLRVKQLLYVNHCDDALNMNLMQSKLVKPGKAKKKVTKKGKTVLKEKNGTTKQKSKEEDQEDDDDEDEDSDSEQDDDEDDEESE